MTDIGVSCNKEIPMRAACQKLQELMTHGINSKRSSHPMHINRSVGGGSGGKREGGG